MANGVRVGTWIGFSCGDFVHGTDDPFHVDHVEAVQPAS
jgi:hypothetical protein